MHAVARLALIVALVESAPAPAAVLQVGPAAALPTPSAAAAVAQDGDTVMIAAGEYFDCAVWRANDLTIAGPAPGSSGGTDAVLTDLACEGKAAFVVRGHDVTLRHLTFTRIRTPDRNGAGVRAEGGNLTIEDSRFVNDQIGVLAGDGPGRLTVRDCLFSGNGVADAIGGTADLLVGAITVLRVERSVLQAGKGGAAITSHALRSEVIGDRITASGAARLAVIAAPDGGSLVMQDTTITLAAGTLPAAPRVVVAVTQDDGVTPGELTIRRTVLDNRSGAPALLLRNWSSAVPLLQDNLLQPGDTEVSSHGATLHWLKRCARGLLDAMQALIRQARHLAAALLHAVHASA